MNTNNFENIKIAIVIPYYNASKLIGKVISKIPSYINTVIIVNDRSPDIFPEEIVKRELNETSSIHVISNKINLGVGGATKKGFKYALETNHDIIIKVDADNQMDLSYLPNLIEPLISKQADMAKGNRFRDFMALQKMPLVRRIGNLALSFLIKIATGYWNNFDPTNGFFSIKSSVLKGVNFKNLSNRYYFETSLLSELYYQKSIIKDIAMPAIYGDEKSSLNAFKMLFVFTGKLWVTFLKRMLKSYFLYDFNIGSIYMFFGIPLFKFGMAFGLYQWYVAYNNNILTPTGTIMIITLSLILGFQLILQAIQFDIISAPKTAK